MIVQLIDIKNVKKCLKISQENLDSIFNKTFSFQKKSSMILFKLLNSHTAVCQYSVVTLRPIESVPRGMCHTSEEYSLR